jgi:hypothetical protein
MSIRAHPRLGVARCVRHLDTHPVHTATELDSEGRPRVQEGVRSEFADDELSVLDQVTRTAPPGQCTPHEASRLAGCGRLALEMQGERELRGSRRAAPCWIKLERHACSFPRSP